jgi:excisionase family DNA binding protein
VSPQSTDPPSSAHVEALLTKRQAAKLLHCCPRTIDNLARAGKLPVVKVGSATRIDPIDLRRYIESQKQNRSTAVTT